MLYVIVQRFINTTPAGVEGFTIKGLYTDGTSEEFRGGARSCDRRSAGETRVPFAQRVSSGTASSWFRGTHGGEGRLQCQTGTETPCSFYLFILTGDSRIP